MCSYIYVPDWVKFCSDIYPDELERKWSAYELKTGNPYTIYELATLPKTYVIIYGESFYESCLGVDIIDYRTFHCLRENNTLTTFKFKQSSIECINHSFDFTDDLIASCLAANERQDIAIPKNKDYITPYINEFTGLIFPGELTEHSGNMSHNKCSSVDQNIWFILFVALFSLIFIRRGKFLNKKTQSRINTR